MSRAVLAPFEAYQKARVTFVQTVAELAQRPQNIEALQSAGTCFSQLNNPLDLKQDSPYECGFQLLSPEDREDTP